MRVRVLKSGVWLHYKEGEIVDTSTDMSLYLRENVVEELSVPLKVDDGKVRHQLRVTDVHHKTSST